MLAYLIARTGSPIQRDVLIEVAGGRGKRPPEHVIPGLKNMLKHWGMGDALQQRGSTFILKPTDSWRTDTDELVELFEDAKAEEAEGHHESAIALLKQAQERDLCTPDADYLPTFDAVPDYSMIIQQKREEWANYQANVLRRLAELGLKMTDRASWDLAASTARLVVRFDPENPESFLLVAKAEEHRGNLTSAREYRNKAAELTRIAIEDLD